MVEITGALRQRFQCQSKYSTIFTKPTFLASRLAQCLLKSKVLYLENSSPWSINYGEYFILWGATAIVEVLVATHELLYQPNYILNIDFGLPTSRALCQHVLFRIRLLGVLVRELVCSPSSPQSYLFPPKTKWHGGQR